MLRVGDCPGGASKNRVGIADLRLFSGTTPVLSDPIIWHEKDSVESASLQFINILFGVPQISVKYNTMSVSHQEMIKNWLDFWSAYREVLLFGDFRPLYPQLNYPLVESEKDGVVVIVLTGSLIVDISLHGKDCNRKEFVIVNGTNSEQVAISITDDITTNLNCYNAQGLQIKIQDYHDNKEFSPGLYNLSVPVSGRLHIQIK